MRSSVRSTYRPPNAAVTDPSCRYSARAARRTRTNATAIRTCHSHHVACQLLATMIVREASARRMNAVATASGNGRRRRRRSRGTGPRRTRRRDRDRRGDPEREGASLGAGRRRNGRRRARRPPTRPSGRGATTGSSAGPIARRPTRRPPAGSPTPSRTARNSPIGVAITNPLLGSSIRTSGVARAWSARNPALARRTRETRKSRPSSRREAASPIAKPSTALITATPSTRRKWRMVLPHHVQVRDREEEHQAEDRQRERRDERDQMAPGPLHGSPRRQPHRSGRRSPAGPVTAEAGPSGPALSSRTSFGVTRTAGGTTRRRDLLPPPAGGPA